MVISPKPRGLQGLRAAVLGSTSGIGREVALTLLEARRDVIVHGRSSLDAAERVAAKARSLGVRAHVLMADLADRGLETDWLRRHGISGGVSTPGSRWLAPIL